MRELSTSLARAIESATDGKIKAITYDIEVDADNLKYSSWLSALATGGLALIITNFDKLLSPYLAKIAPPPIGPIAAGISLAGAIAAGAYLNWAINQDFLCKRQMMTAWIKQKCLLFAGEVGVAEDEENLFGRVASGDFLSVQDQRIVAELDEKTRNAPKSERIILAQGAMVLLGYVLSFASAARGF